MFSTKPRKCLWIVTWDQLVYTAHIINQFCHCLRCYCYNAVIKQKYSSGARILHKWVPKVCLFPLGWLKTVRFNTRTVAVHAWFKCEVKEVFLCSCWCDSGLFLIRYLSIIYYARDPNEDNSFNFADQHLFHYNYELLIKPSVYIKYHVTLGNNILKYSSRCIQMMVLAITSL